MATIITKNLGRITLGQVESVRRSIISAGYGRKEFHRGAKLVVKTIYKYSVRVMGDTYHGTITASSYTYPKVKTIASLVTLNQASDRGIYTDDSLVDRLGGERVILGA